MIGSVQSLACVTNRLLLRPLSLADETLFQTLYTAPETMRFIDEPLSAAQAVRRFRAIVRRQAESSFDGQFLVMLEKTSRRPMGICGTSLYDPEKRRIEVGLVLLPERRSHGFAREALAGLVNRLFELAQVDEVHARFMTGNDPARNLVARVGFLPGSAAAGLGQGAEEHWSVQRASWCAGNVIHQQGKSSVQRDRFS